MRDGLFEASDFRLGHFIEPRLMVYNKEDRDEIVEIVNKRTAEEVNALLPALKEQWLAEIKKLEPVSVFHTNSQACSSNCYYNCNAYRQSLIQK